MKRITLRVALLALLVMAGSLAAQENGIAIDSVDLAVSNDFPIGAYQDKSSYNLGYAVQLNVGYARLPWLRVFAQLDNNYWLATPDWIDFGTQVDGLVGMGAHFPLKAIGGLGTLDWGAEASYGFMAHFASADTSGDGNEAFFFMDQVVGLALEANLRLDNAPLGIFVKPRYLLSPELNDVKHQLGVLAGVRVYVEALK